MDHTISKLIFMWLSPLVHLKLGMNNFWNWQLWGHASSPSTKIFSKKPLMLSIFSYRTQILTVLRKWNRSYINNFLSPRRKLHRQHLLSQTQKFWHAAMVPTIENGEELCILVCFTFFSRKIRYHKQSSDCVERYFIFKPSQSWFEWHCIKLSKYRDKLVLKILRFNVISSDHRTLYFFFIFSDF